MKFYNGAKSVKNLVLFFVLAACAQTIKKTPKSSDPIKPVNNKNNIVSKDSQEKLGLIESREERLLYESYELEKLKEINPAFCESLNKIRKECSAKKPITSNGTLRQLQCDGSLVEKNLENKVEADIQTDGSEGSFLLVFGDNAYESIPLIAGTQELKFHETVDDQTKTQTFDRVSKIKLKVNSLTPPKNSSVSKVTLRILVDGEALLNQTVMNVKSGGFYDLSIKEIYQKMLSNDCQVSNKDLDAFLSKVNERVEKLDLTNQVLPYKAESANKNLSSEALEKRLRWLNEKIANMYPTVESARNISFKIKNELLGGSGIGCKIKEPINIISIAINGSKEIENVNFKSASKLKSSGSSDTLDINLGSISYATSNFLGETVPGEDYSSFNIGSITRIKLRKKGLKFNSPTVPCDGGKIENFIDENFGDGNTCYDNHEEDVMHINSIKLSVNGIVLYQKGSLGIKLNRLTQSWTLNNLQSTPKWSEMLLRKDCNFTE